MAFWIQKDHSRARNLELVRLALANWTNATDHRLRFEESTEPTPTSIRIYFSRQQPNFGTARPVVHEGTGSIESADVILASNPIGDRLERDIVVYLTALHELGHALGLAHSDTFGEIMYGFRDSADADRTFAAYRSRLSSSGDIGSARASGLSEADRQAIRNLYPQPPD